MLLSFIKYVSTNFPLLYPDDLTIDRCTKNGNSLFDIENRFKYRNVFNIFGKSFLYFSIISVVFSYCFSL